MDRPHDPHSPTGFDADLDTDLGRPSDVPIHAEDADTSDTFGDGQRPDDNDNARFMGGLSQEESRNFDNRSAEDLYATAEVSDTDNAEGAVEGTTSDPSEPNAVDAVTFEGKKVFSPHELNQSGEDKEYFPPEKDHQFDVPKDANDHALTPDIEVTPDNDVKIIR